MLCVCILYIWCFCLPSLCGLGEVAGCGEIQITLQSVSRSDELKSVQVRHAFILVLLVLIGCFTECMSVGKCIVHSEPLKNVAVYF